MGMGAWEQVDKSMWTGVCEREHNFILTSFLEWGWVLMGAWRWECGNGRVGMETFLKWGWKCDFFQHFLRMGMGVWRYDFYSMGTVT